MDKLGRYHLAEQVAAQEITSTYRGYHVAGAGIVRPVAVKRLLPALEREVEIIALLVDEGRINADLDHPAIVQMFDIDEDGGRWFLATERVLGRSLAQLVTRARAQGTTFDPLTAAYIVMTLLDGLAHAHERTDADGNLLGLVHRDLCPANVTIGYHGEVKLGGFTYARSRARPAPPPPGLGTPRYNYLSPEQASGLELDFRADLFSAGLILYELLSGHPPYVARSREEALALAQRGDVRLLSEVAPHVSADLRTLVDHALAFDRRARPASAAAFRDELARALYQRDPTYGAHQLAAFVARVLREESADDRRREAAERAELQSTSRALPEAIARRTSRTPTPQTASQTSELRPDTGRLAAPTPKELDLTAERPAPRPSVALQEAPRERPLVEAVRPDVQRPDATRPIVPSSNATLQRSSPMLVDATRPAIPAPRAPVPQARVPQAGVPQASVPQAGVPTPAPSARSGPLPAREGPPFGKLALGLVAVLAVALVGFALSSPSNKRLVERKLRTAFIGRQPGGTLVVESLPPGASVIIDDEPTGRKTPVTIENFESGYVHDLRLELEGEPTLTSTVSVKPGAKQTVTLVFPDAMVNLSVKTDPPNAELFIDGRSVSLTPASMMVRVDRELHVRVVREGYVEYVEVITPEKKSSINLDVRLEKSEALLEQEAKAKAEAEAAE